MFDLKKTIAWIIAVTAMLSYQYAEATTGIDVNVHVNIDSIIATEASTYRAYFKADASMPNHYAFLNLMRKFASEDSERTQQENLIEVQSLFDISEQSAQEFLYIIKQSYTAMTFNNRMATQKMLCSKSLYIDDREATYELLNILHDIKEANLVRQYQLANLATSHLGAQQRNVSREFKQWIEMLKPEQTYYKFDHAVLYAQSEEDVEIVVSRACRFLASN